MLQINDNFSKCLSLPLSNNITHSFMCASETCDINVNVL